MGGLDQVELAYLLSETGRASEAEPLFDESLEAATALGERGVVARVLLHRALSGMGNLKVDPEHLQAAAKKALETFGELGDLRGVADAGRHIAHGLRRQGRVAAARAALERALAAADASGDRLVRRQVVGSLGFVLWLGPTPVGEAIPRCDELLASSRGDRGLEAAVSRSLSALYAMAGRFEEAREHVERSGPVLKPPMLPSGGRSTSTNRKETSPPLLSCVSVRGRRSCRTAASNRLTRRPT